MVKYQNVTSLGHSDWEPIPRPGTGVSSQQQPGGSGSGSGGHQGEQRPSVQNSILHDVGQRSPPETPEPEESDTAHHCKGVLIMLGLMVFHFLWFLVTLSIGVAVGMLSGALHEICWDSVMIPFWQIYIALITIAFLVELSFRFGHGTKMNIWIDNIQRKYYLELYYVPRIMYFWGYVGAVVLLFYAYYGSHHGPKPKTDSNKPTTPYPQILSPLALNRSDDHFHYSSIFFIALCYMIYVISKDNDWMTYRKAVVEDGDSDPVSRGSIGSFALYGIVHIFITFVYALPLIGCVLLFRQFDFGAKVTYFWGNTMAVVVGIAAVFIERRTPFPTEPLQPPHYNYENHLRIRLALLQLWLIPLAAGNFFDSTRADPLDAQNNDLLIFTVEVGIGIVQAVKIFGSAILVHLSLRRAHQYPNESIQTDPTRYDYHPGASITSMARETQTGDLAEEQDQNQTHLTAQLQHVSMKPENEIQRGGSNAGTDETPNDARPNKEALAGPNPFESEMDVPFVLADDQSMSTMNSDTSMTLIKKNEALMTATDINNANTRVKQMRKSMF